MVVEHKHFATTTRGLRRDIPPMKLYEKAKQFGVWNPSTIDFTQDQQDWQTRMSAAEKDIILRLTALFQAGEEAVTLDLLPLIMVIASEGRIEEEMFLTTFLWEEAKHTDFFNRFLTEVAGAGPDLTSYIVPSYRTIFYEALPSALSNLTNDPSPAAQVRASVTYNMIVEGVLAETGYHAYYTALRENDLLPGQTSGIDKLKQDESRHIAYGIFLISRLIAENNDLWALADETMSALLPAALSTITEIFQHYDPIPFGLSVDAFVNYAMMQYQKRYARIEQAKTMSLDEIYRITQAAIEQGDA